MPSINAQPIPNELQAVSRIFEQAQLSISNHSKNHVALHKIHQECAKRKELVNNGTSFKLTGERQFRDMFQNMYVRMLQVKKRVASAENVIKFIGGYIKFINERPTKDEDEISVTEEDEDETPESRFTVYLLKFLLEGFHSKDKIVRFRVLQTMAGMVSYLGSVEEDIFNKLRAYLIERVLDKEATIRTQAILSLAKLYFSEDEDDLNEEQSILDVMLDTLGHDPSADVRRATLVNIPILRESINAILDRMADRDPTVRKLVFTDVLKKYHTTKDNSGNVILGPTHPKALTISQRELIVKIGLGDRDPSVRTVAATLIGTWVDAVECKVEDTNDSIGEKEKKKVLTFLDMFDLGGERYAIKANEKFAENALLSLFITRPVLFDELSFEDDYWEQLTLEKAFLARVFVQYCKEKQDEARLEASMPVMIYIAFRIEGIYNSIVEDHTELGKEDIDEAEYARIDDERLNKESIISELLKMAINLDYSDEIGRRKVLQLVRDILKANVLPEDVTAKCLEVLRKVANDERDLIRMVVETISELRDGAYGGLEEEDSEPAPALDGEDDASSEALPTSVSPIRQSREQMSGEQKVLVDQTDLTCLALCIETLKLVNSTFQENSTLDAVEKKLIFPSLKRDEDPDFAERGLRALGLCCLIDLDRAMKSIDYFKRVALKAESSIKLAALQSLFDILMKHEKHIYRNPKINLQEITDFFLDQILKEQDPKIKALLCVGVSKLILSGMITSVHALQTLMKTYLSPLTADNQDLRQCLSFFFPMYGCSSFENQRRMCNTFIPIFLDNSEDRKDANGLHCESQYVSSTQLATMFVDWTDPNRFKDASEKANPNTETPVNDSAQLTMAEDILRLLFEKDLKIKIEKEDKRALCQVLNRLHIPDTVDDHRIRSLKLLLDKLKMYRPLRDAASINALTKFESMISKKFEKELEGFSEAEYRKFGELTETFEFLDSIIPLDDDELLDADFPRRNKKRRSHSMASATSDSRANSPLPDTEKPRSRAKRPRLSVTSGDEEPTEGSTSRLKPAPTRRVPKRAAAARKQPEVILISSDSEDEPAISANTQKSMPRYPVKVELDDSIGPSVGPSSVGETTFDSIMDSEDESEDEEEVTNLLAEDA